MAAFVVRDAIQLTIGVREKDGCRKVRSMQHYFDIHSVIVEKAGIMRT